jgi:hypothetical protein
MLSNDTRKRLEDIVRGAIIERDEDNCTATRNILCRSFSTSTTVKRDFESKSVIKEEQAEELKQLANGNGWWVDPPGETQYLARGGEAIVYLDNENKNVIKLNDAVYYATWLEFLNSIIIHNILFKDTPYTLIGFHQSNTSFCAVLKQPYIMSDAPVDLADVKKLLEHNGFINTKRNDYYNKELGIILEDMHDENIISNSNTLFFIDSVFYTVTPDGCQ